MRWKGRDVLHCNGRQWFCNRGKHRQASSLHAGKHLCLRLQQLPLTGTHLSMRNMRPPLLPTAASSLRTRQTSSPPLHPFTPEHQEQVAIS